MIKKFYNNLIYVYKIYKNFFDNFDNNSNEKTLINNNNNDNNNLNNFNENNFKSFISKFIEDKIFLNKIKEKIKTSSNNELISLWNEFKIKSLIFFFASIYLVKYLTIISIINNNIINLYLNKKIFFNSNNILKKNWEIINNIFDTIFNNISNIISNEINSISIKTKFNFNQIKNIINNICLNLFEKIDFFNLFLNEIENYINSLENNNFIINNNDNNFIFIDNYIYYYNTYYDIISSNLFKLVFKEIIINEINNNLLILKSEFKENEKTFAKILLIIDNIRINFLTNNNNNNDFFIENEILDEFNNFLINILV